MTNFTRKHIKFTLIIAIILSGCVKSKIDIIQAVGPIIKNSLMFNRQVKGIFVKIHDNEFRKISNVTSDVILYGAPCGTSERPIDLGVGSLKDSQEGNLFFVLDDALKSDLFKGNGDFCVWIETTNSYFSGVYRSNHVKLKPK